MSSGPSRLKMKNFNPSRPMDMDSTYKFQTSFNRPNLHYYIHQKKKTSLDEIADYIKTKQKHKSGIIYCLSRKVSFGGGSRVGLGWLWLGL